MLHPDYEFIPVFNGFALNFLRSSQSQTLERNQPVFRKVEAFNNYERMLWNPTAKFPRQLNNVTIEFIIPNRQNVLYQYKLNESGTWSDWTPVNTAEFIGLKHGKYKLFVRARIGDIIIEKMHPGFTIAAPWYFSWYAWVLYGLMLAALTAAIIHWQRGSLKKQKKMLVIRQRNSLREQTDKHKQEIFLLEQKRLQAEFDQLKQQLRNKTIELAKKGRDIEEKNRLLLSLKEKCEKAQQNPAIFEIKWTEMQRLLDSYLKIEDKTFEIQMDELHQEFFKKLKDQFPDISNNDLRLCAYVKIGLNSKEIAEILNIQPSSFYISRSRLRKKLNLKTDEDLYSFLNAV